MVLQSFREKLTASLLCLSLCSFSVPVRADLTQDDTDELENTPSIIAMAGDLILARPVLVAITAAGAGLFVLTLPFSATGGNVREAAAVLVRGPAEQAFMRCLGCTATQDRWKKQREAKEAEQGIKTDTAANY